MNGKPNTLLNIIVKLYLLGYEMHETHKDVYTELYTVDGVPAPEPSFEDGYNQFGAFTEVDTELMSVEIEPIQIGVTSSGLLCPLHNEINECIQKNDIVKAMIGDIQQQLVPAREFVQKQNRYAPTVDVCSTAFIAAFEYACWQCGSPMEPVEWDCGWQYHGVVDYMKVLESVAHRDG